MTELYLFVFATAALSAEIRVYTPWLEHSGLKGVVRPVLTLPGIIPGLAAACIGVLVILGRANLGNGWAFLSAGLFLESASVQLDRKAAVACLAADERMTLLHDPGNLGTVTADVGKGIWQGPDIFLSGSLLPGGLGMFLPRSGLWKPRVPRRRCGE